MTPLKLKDQQSTLDADVRQSVAETAESDQQLPLTVQDRANRLIGSAVSTGTARRRARPGSSSTTQILTVMLTSAVRLSGASYVSPVPSTADVTPLAPVFHHMGYNDLSLVLSVWVIIECSWFLFRPRSDRSTRHTPLTIMLPAAVGTFLRDCVKSVGRHFQPCSSWLLIILLGLWGSIMHSTQIFGKSRFKLKITGDKNHTVFNI